MISINNPGNLRPLPDGETWNGQTGILTTSKGEYCEFDTSEHGIRALAKNLMAYKRVGVSTVLEFAAKWAPEEDHNSPTSYASFVAAELGIMPTDPIDLSDGVTLVRMAKAISIMENGWAPTGGYWYDDATYTAGVNAALTGA